MKLPGSASPVCTTSTHSRYAPCYTFRRSETIPCHRSAEIILSFCESPDFSETFCTLCLCSFLSSCNHLWLCIHWRCSDHQRNKSLQHQRVVTWSTKTTSKISSPLHNPPHRESAVITDPAVHRFTASWTHWHSSSFFLKFHGCMVTWLIFLHGSGEKDL